MSYFGSRDLALLLPDQVGDAYSLRHSSHNEETEEYHELKPKIDPSKKVSRYFRGQTPAWIKDEELSEGMQRMDDNHLPVHSSSHATTTISTANRSETSSSVDPRLARLAKLSSVKNESASSSAHGRRRIEAQVIVEADDYSAPLEEEEKPMPSRLLQQQAREPDSDNDDIQARRERILAKRSQVQEPESSAEEEDEGEEASSASASEYETDSDESSEGETERLRPVFVPKHLRTTIKDQAMIEAEEELKLKKKKEADMNRKQLSRTMLAESLKRRDEAMALDETDGDSDAGLPDVTDDPNDPIEVSLGNRLLDSGKMT
jgi:hypothetical protein